MVDVPAEGHLLHLVIETRRIDGLKLVQLGSAAVTHTSRVCAVLAVCPGAALLHWTHITEEMSPDAP